MLQLKAKFYKQFHKISHYVKRCLMAIGEIPFINNKTVLFDIWSIIQRLQYVMNFIYNLFSYLFLSSKCVSVIICTQFLWFHRNVNIRQRGILPISRWATSQSRSFICCAKSDGGSHNRDARTIRTLLRNG